MKSRVHVFAGPSLPLAERRPIEGMRYHAPAAQGDLYALVALRPLAIAIIDGYFERVPAVWHKEVLWALSQGVHVYGAASMGALRAVELEPFGMVGIGKVFADFMSGALTDDDEVTIVHAEQGQGFRPGSEALVNIRATLASAAARGVLSDASEKAVIAFAKRQFYPERGYPALLCWAREHIPAPEFARLQSWLANKENHVDVKREDARQLVSVMEQLVASPPPPVEVNWRFNHTDAWEQVRRICTPEGAATDEAASAPSTLGLSEDQCSPA